jgi:stage V sporulation protein D (sporulation-specific penicillin-binding protein)
MLANVHHRTVFRGKQEAEQNGRGRSQTIYYVFCMFGLAVIVRLFFLMVLQHGFYTALAKGTQETSAELIPERGQIYVQDSRSKEPYPIAINKDYYLVYADTRLIKSDVEAGDVTEKIAAYFSYDEEKKNTLFQKMNK